MSRDWLEILREILECGNGLDDESEGILEPEMERLKHELHRGDRRSREMIVRELYQSRELGNKEIYNRLQERGNDMSYSAYIRNLRHMKWKNIIEEKEEGSYRLTEEGKAAAKEVWEDIE